jgi:ADP-ribose pyrophosphatase YjhB (NUDIX family)
MQQSEIARARTGDAGAQRRSVSLFRFAFGAAHNAPVCAFVGGRKSRHDRAMIDKLLNRLVLQPWWRLTRAQMLGVQAIVVEPPRRVLLVRLSYARGWHLPGGGVERHETLEEALARELREECGVVPTARPALHGLFANHARAKGDHIAVFVVRAWTMPAPPKRGLEILERKMFAMDALPEGLIDGARRRLEEVFEGKEPPARW